MMECLVQDEGPVTNQLIFKDTGISEKIYKQLERRLNRYDENLVLTHDPVDGEVIIIVNKKCEDDDCRREEVKKFIDFYDGVLSKLTFK